MKVIRAGIVRAWWDGMTGKCDLCGGEFTLEATDEVKYFDWMLSPTNADGKTPSPNMACPTKGCMGAVHFWPAGDWKK